MTNPTRVPRKLRAYYYSFEPTGDDRIDAILEAVARAGKAYHHTSEWCDGGHIDNIQEAANRAASLDLSPADD